MFVTTVSYLSKAGQEDAIIALYEDWERTQGSKAQGFISGELLRNCEDTRAFMAIMRFESQESAQAYLLNREHDGWYQRLVSLTEKVSTHTNYISEWQVSVPHLINTSDTRSAVEDDRNTMRSQ